MAVSGSAHATSHSPSPHTSQSAFKSSSAKRSSRRVWLGRVLFPVCLCVVAAILGYLSYFFLSHGEKELAESQFDSVADRALDSALGIMQRKRLGTVSMASIASSANPYADNWPFVTITGYEEMSTNLIETSSGREMGFCPLVTPEQLSDFEDFAYDYYENSRIPPFPSGTALSSFGKGVWGVDPSLNTTDNRYRETITDESTSWGSPNKIFAPILHHNLGPFPALMLNLRFQETRGVIIDDLITCANERAATGNLSTECISITDMLFLTSQVDGTGPGALIMQPIYPAYNATVLTGLVASSIVWSEILENIFAHEVSGIDCVLVTETQAYTYSVNNGLAYFRGEGEIYDRRYDSYRRQISLTPPGLFSNASAVYMLSLYPCEDFFYVYSTNNPTLAAIGAVLIILCTSFVFFFYDFFVRQEDNAKKELLEAKRKFMRFVSHEVRTPLNSVCMGLTLMRDEMQASLGMKKERGWEGASLLEVPNSAQAVSAKKVLELLHLTGEIFGNAQSSVDVLNDLLNYDKIEIGTFTLELTVIPIWRLIESTASEFKLPAAKKNIAFAVDFSTLYDSEVDQVASSGARHLSKESREAKVVGDTIRLTQVIRNLISNAVKFTPERGALTIRATWKNDDEGRPKVCTKFILNDGIVAEYPARGQMELSVSDTGAGMSEDQLSQLFGDGVQFNVNELQAGQGSGIGLFITKGIVEQHGGTLRASSEGLGKGTTFTISLPLYHIPDEILDSEGPTADYSAGSDEVGDTEEPVSLRILIVDDSMTNRKLLKRLLQNKGHRCELAEDGQDAVDQVTQAMKEGILYDTILMDSEMPVKGGPLATKELRSLGCDSFIIGITGNVLPEDVAHFKECGANDVLPKPFDMPQLETMWMEYGLLGKARDISLR